MLSTKKLNAAAMVLIFGALAPAQAQEKDGENYEEMVVLGTRSSKERSVLDATAPIDIIDGSDLRSAVGGDGDLIDSLQASIPSYVAPVASGSDGSAFVRPTTLRGMAGDETLVLVNGKRRHRSALIQLFSPPPNRGSHAPDIAMIPTIGLKRVEVLRDGASAQYGSDAIAGVMNFALRDDDEGASVAVSYGQHFEGEANWKVSGVAGAKLCDDGHFTIAMDTNKMDHISRGEQHPAAKWLKDQGKDIGKLKDDIFNEDGNAQTWGRPQQEASRFVANASCKVGKADVYAFANFAQVEQKWSFFYRHPEHAALCADAGTDDDWDCGPGGANYHQSVARAKNLERQREVGFVPHLVGNQDDYGVTVGFKGEGAFGTDAAYDFSVSKGFNHMDYTLNNSLNFEVPLGDKNAALNAGGGRDFANDGLAIRDHDTTDLRQQETAVNADLTMDLNATTFLSYGLEYRKEIHTQYAGSWEARYQGGVSGMAGTKFADQGTQNRTSYSAYADMEKDMSEDLLLQGALRFGDFEDFGSTFTGKLAARYTLGSMVTLRGAVSTGFKAPTPGQVHLASTVTNFEDRDSTNPGQEEIRVRHVPATHEDAKAYGGKALEEEKSMNISLGAGIQLSNTSNLTLDVYQIKLEDRIYKTEFEDDDRTDHDLGIYEDFGFYTNALDTSYTGIDLVYSTHFRSAMTDLSLALNYNKIEVDGRKKVNGAYVVGDDVVEDIETHYPEIRFTAMGNTRFNDKLNLMSRLRYFGSHYDHNGTIEGPKKSFEIPAVYYLDLELGYKAMKNLTVALGGNNVLDTYPDEIPEEYQNDRGAGLKYPQSAAAGFEGGSWYLKGIYTF